MTAALVEDFYGEAARLYSPCAEIRWPSARHGFGRGFWIGCMLQLRAALKHVRLRIDHIAARPLPDEDIATAVRWSLVGIHGGAGVWGAPTGREVLILGITHSRVRCGSIVEEVTVFDELAVLRQVAGGLGA